MRRPLGALALGLMLLGTEVATGAVSVGAGRLWLGLHAAVRGDAFLLSTPRYLAGATILLLGVVTLAGVFWADVVRRRGVAEGSACPKCGTHTKRVRRRTRHRILSTILETDVTRRHCERCGWRGLAA